MDEFSLAFLLREAFPNYASLPSDCWVRLCINENPHDFADTIQALGLERARRDFIRRLRDEHPTGRTHKPQHDDGILNAATEAEAYAWAVNTDGRWVPEFVLEQGCPDLRFEGGWIEAKTINVSEAERRLREEIRPRLERGEVVTRSGALVAPDDGLVGKFEHQFQDSLKKWERQNKTGRLIVFYCWDRIDFGTSRTGAREAVSAWAFGKNRPTGVEIVICYNHDWRRPFFSSV